MTSMLHPSHPNFRFIFLFFLCFMTFGSYWCYDIPAAIQSSLTSGKYNLSTTEFALLYSVYNFMNIGIVLFGGYFIDVIGLRSGSILFCVLIAVGQVVFSVGGSLSNGHTAFLVMLAGRIIFSLGGESLSVAQSTYCARWFKGSELAFSFGVTLSFSRIGSFTNLDVTPHIASKWGVSIAIWCGTLACVVSVVLTILASFSDKVKESSAKLTADPDKKEVPKVPFRISDILHFPPSLWLIYFICVCYYIPIFTLISVSGVKYLEAAAGFTESRSLTFFSIPYIMSAVLAPFCGFAVDKVGRKPLFLTLTSALMVGTYALLLFVINKGFNDVAVVIVSVVILGLSYSLCAASLWPCVPLLVHEDRVGTAYAIMNSIQNAGLAVASLTAGALTCDSGKTLECARRPILFLALIAILSTALAATLMFYDLGHGKVLTKKSAKTEKVDEYGHTESSSLLGKENAYDINS